MHKKLLVLLVGFAFTQAVAQIKDKTHIRGFMDIGGKYEFQNIDNKIVNDKLNFVLGEQDLFITSDISERISFLGESVLKYDGASSTKFAISLERAIFKLNYFRNHSFFAGKVHTALNYWNDSYHHGRLFFPTIGRPELFNQSIIPIHTTGIGLSGENLTDLKIGYTLMAGNGLGSSDISDDNVFKSYVAAVHFKPIEGLRLGASAYFDNISGSVHVHDAMGKDIVVNNLINQKLFSGSIAYFKNNYEFLAEGSNCINSTDSIGSRTTKAGYIYFGYKIKDIIAPYVRYDRIIYQNGEMLFKGANTESFCAGIRYEMSYLTVFKLEYQYKQSLKTAASGPSIYTNNISFQIALGF
jgi:hypothetical protein